MSVLANILLSTILGAAPQSAQKNETQIPTELTAEQSDALAKEFRKLLYPITIATVNSHLDLAVKPETTDKLAKFKRQLYLSLQKEGFTKEEALVITANTQIPTPTISGSK